MERFRQRFAVSLTVILLNLVLLFQHTDLCFSLNDEGRTLLMIKELVEVDPYASLASWDGGEEDGDVSDPCSWAGIGCEDGRVVSLNLEDLCLKGTLSPEVGRLRHLRYLILRKNSFYGAIPREIGELRQLKVLDLGENNFSGLFPYENSNLLSLEVLGLRHATIRRLLQMKMAYPIQKYNRTSHAPVRTSPQDMVTTATTSSPPPYPPPTIPPQPSSGLSCNCNLNATQQAAKKKNSIIYISIGVPVGLLIIVAAAVLYCRTKKAVTVKPWATGLSGQLQKAFVTGIPVLRWSELDTACEGFSNIVGSSGDCMIYKGTLSSGVEIAVTSVVVKSAKDWSKHSKAQFRKKIATLSRVNHKNFVNFIGYCEEEKPFARMMVFEYAPNGSLYDHLHIKEAQDLGWAARLRIAMGGAYCLEHMHQLDPPVILKTLGSSSILLTDDYAAKISDFDLNEITMAEKGFGASDPSNDETLNKENVVYKFGVLLLEIISGRLPYSDDNGDPLKWASGYLRGEKPLKNLIDPMLETVGEEDVADIISVIESCLNPDPKERSSMKDVAARLREITSVHPEAATPKISPLWWAELEIISTVAS